MGAVLAHQCPHCRTEKVALSILGHAKGPETKLVAVFLFCPICRKPSSAMLEAGRNLQMEYLSRRGGGISATQPDWEEAADRAADDFPKQGDPTTSGWALSTFWPAAPTPVIPEFLPPQVALAFRQAEANFHSRGMDETAAGAYGRALEIGTKLIVPDFKGALYDRIQHLAQERRITPELATWAHDIRSIRNGALHGIEGISREELTHVRGLADMVLRYLFTLPGMLAARKADADKAKG